MEKKVYIDGNAERELRKLTEDAQEKFEAYFIILRKEGKLGFPDARKIRSSLFEIRVKHEGEYRGFYAYIGKKEIIILHIFQKKTQKTPIKNIEVAERRLSRYE